MRQHVLMVKATYLRVGVPISPVLNFVIKFQCSQDNAMIWLAQLHIDFYFFAFGLCVAIISLNCTSGNQPSPLILTLWKMPQCTLLIDSNDSD